MEKGLGALAAEDPAGAVLVGVVDFEGAVDGCHGGCGVREDTCQTHVVGLTRDVFKAESLADGLLEEESQVSVAGDTASVKKGPRFTKSDLMPAII